MRLLRTLAAWYKRVFPPYQPVKPLLLSYIEANPGCTVSQISRGLDLSFSFVGPILFNMALRGEVLVHSTRLPVSQPIYAVQFYYPLNQGTKS